MSMWWLNGLCVNLIGWKCMLNCVDACGWLSLKGIMAGTGFLAQASLPRPGEISRGSPRTCCSISRLDERFLFLSEEWSRLGERGLAWARPRRVRSFPFAISLGREGFRLSERTPSLERALLAWARQWVGWGVIVEWCTNVWLLVWSKCFTLWVEGWCHDWYMKLRWEWYVVVCYMNWKAWVAWWGCYTWC